MQTETNETGELSLAELDAVSGGDILDPITDLVRVAIHVARAINNEIIWVQFVDAFNRIPK